MRPLKFIFIGFAVVILGFFSLGLIHSSFSYTNTVVIDATVEQTFAVFADESLAAEWLTGYIGHEVLEGAPNQPGSKFLMKFVQEGQEVEFVEILKVYEENAEFTFDLETGYFDGEVQILFSGSSPTTISVITVTKGTNIAYRSMFYLMKNMFQEQSQKNYELLKELVEAEVAINS
jgi:hypothetical protein